MDWTRIVFVPFGRTAATVSRFTAPARTCPRWWSVWFPLTSVRPGAEKYRSAAPPKAAEKPASNLALSFAERINADMKTSQFDQASLKTTVRDFGRILRSNKPFPKIQNTPQLSEIADDLRCAPFQAKAVDIQTNCTAKWKRNQGATERIGVRPRLAAEKGQ